MSDEREAIERLERRVAQLEALVRQLVASPAPPSHRPPPLPPKPAAPRRAVDLEQLVGQRGLLIVGVLALIATAGFFLKYAIEQGWISPELRALGGVVLGIAIAGLGEWLVAPPRALRAYGAALIGGGGALVYLACWAAAGPYELVSRPVGTGLLFATTAAVALRAVFHRLEPLTVWALIGAYLAPIFLPRPATEPAWFWGYLALVGVAAGTLATRYAWRTTLDVALAGYYLLPTAITGNALSSPTGMTFLAAGGVGALLATGAAGRRWPEARLGGSLIAWWTLLEVAGSRTSEAARWAALAGGAAIALVTWWQTREAPLFGAKDKQGQIHLQVEDIVFALNPLAFGVLADALGPRRLDAWAGLVPALTAALYLVPGWVRRTPQLVALGGVLAGLAVASQWDGPAVAVGLALLAVSATLAERRYGVRPGRELAVGLAGAAFVQVFLVTLGDRSSLDRAFTGSWSLGWYALTAGAVVVGRLWPGTADRWLQALWGLAGLSVFVGGSIELPRFFHGLAADLSLSAFWIVYAGVLVQLGFWRGQKAIRAAGLGVAGLAVFKIAFYDLSTLRALYRVGSFFVLSLIALAVAYAYNKRR